MFYPAVAGLYFKVKFGVLLQILPKKYKKNRPFMIGR